MLDIVTAIEDHGTLIEVCTAEGQGRESNLAVSRGKLSDAGSFRALESSGGGGGNERYMHNMCDTKIKLHQSVQAVAAVIESRPSNPLVSACLARVGQLVQPSSSAGVCSFDSENLCRAFIRMVMVRI